MTILYDVSAADYHASKHIGSTQIRAFLRSPQLYLDMRAGILPPPGKAAAFGTGSHIKLLEPQRYARESAVMPEGMKLSTNEGKDWARLNRGKLFISYKDHKRLTLMHERMPDEIRAIFADDGRAEATVRTTIDGLPVQCRPDWWVRDTVYDLKTIHKIESIPSRVWSAGYHIQQAWYQRVIQAEVGRMVNFSFIFAETNSPHRWRKVTLREGYEFKGLQQVRIAIDGIQASLKSGCWAGPEPVDMDLDVPEWVDQDLTENEDGEIDA